MRRFTIGGDFNWRYALGEIFLIFAGITAALAANDWYSDRADKLLEAEYLDRLRVDLELDVSGFSGYEGTLERKASLLRALLTETEASLLSRGTDRLMDDLNMSSFVALDNVQSTTFQELQSTGNLALIRDAKIRADLASYYSFYDYIFGINDQSLGPYRQILYSSLPGGAVYDERVGVKSMSEAELRSGLQRLLAHPDLETAVNAELAYSARLIDWQRNFRMRAQEFVQRLDSVR